MGKEMPKVEVKFKEYEVLGSKISNPEKFRKLTEEEYAKYKEDEGETFEIESISHNNPEIFLFNSGSIYKEIQKYKNEETVILVEDEEKYTIMRYRTNKEIAEIMMPLKKDKYNGYILKYKIKKTKEMIEKSIIYKKKKNEQNFK